MFEQFFFESLKLNRSAGQPAGIRDIFRPEKVGIREDFRSGHSAFHCIPSISCCILSIFRPEKVGI